MTGERSDRPVALITGASGGIGEAFCHILAAEGYSLVLVSRSAGELNRVAGVVASRHNVKASVVDMDLSLSGAGARLKADLDSRGLRPDVLINNAGWGLNRTLLDSAPEELLNIVDLNVRALTDLTIRFLPAMRERGRGGVLNLGSMAGFMPGPSMAVYYASKAYVVSFTEAVAREMEGTGVTVSVYCPGPVLTGFQRRAEMLDTRLMRMLRPLSAETCAKAGWDAFKKGQIIAFPRGIDAMGAFFSRVMPRRVTYAGLEFFHQHEKR